ncbi:MAG: Uma2 family endonuclease, partial [Chloroflexota bacterium]|nr:Uma2 family endonuclease [Chloroflexota bacterium]
PNLARGREPDLMIVLKEHQDRRTPTFLDGVADICIEIVSPESVERDYVTKFEEYEKGGVAEYWLFDANRRTAVFHVLDASGIYQEYPRDPKGRLISSLLPGFALDPAFLWSDDLLDDDAVATAIEAILAN